LPYRFRDVWLADLQGRYWHSNAHPRHERRFGRYWRRVHQRLREHLIDRLHEVGNRPPGHMVGSWDGASGEGTIWFNGRWRKLRDGRWDGWWFREK
jgi:hypothetical protein